MTLDHIIVRAFIKAFPHAHTNYESLLELSKDLDSLRETHEFLIHMASGDAALLEEVDSLMTTWRRDLNAQMCLMVSNRGQKKLDV